MRKAGIVIVVAAAAAGGFYRLSAEPSRDSALEPSSTDTPHAGSTDSALETTQAGVVWRKLRDRLTARQAEVPSETSGNASGSAVEE